MTKDMTITVHIERLVIDGISIPQRHRPVVQAALEQELAHLLANGGIATPLHTSGMLQRIPAGTLELDESDEPHILGEKIARAVYKGIGQ